MDFGSNKYQFAAHGYSNKVVPPGVFPVFDTEPAQHSFLQSTTTTPFFAREKNWWCASLFISSLSQWPNLRSSKVNIAPPRKDCQIFTLLETNNLGLKIDLSGASCFFWVYIFGSSCHFSWKECKLLMIHVRLTNNDNGENTFFYTIYICKWLIFWLLC